MFKKIALVTVVPIGALLVLAAIQPDTFYVQRSASINASPEKIFPLINTMRSGEVWSPYYKKDPAMQGVYSGPESGKGAAFEFDGNKEVGKGRVTIIDSESPSKVVMQLDMRDPFEAHNVVEFTLEPTGDATQVTWAMQGRLPYLAKVVHLVLDMDRMVGKDFETGLANLKALSEE